MPLQPNCECPADSSVQTLMKINNNLLVLFGFLSSDAFTTGQSLNNMSCLCSETKILAVINTNIARFADWIEANPTGGNVRSGTVALAQNDTSKAITFSTAFTGAGVPSLVPTVIPPIGGDAIDAWVEDGDVTNAGATITFSAAIPTSGYYLAFVANKE